MSTFEKDKSIMDGKGENDVEWITVKGVHIPVKDGENIQEVISKQFIIKKEKALILPKQEYAEVCSAIRTKYGNKIPKNAGMLYNNSYYCYNYNSISCKIIFKKKIEIIGNEDVIARLGGKNVK